MSGFRDEIRRLKQRTETAENAQATAATMIAEAHARIDEHRAFAATLAGGVFEAGVKAAALRGALEDLDQRFRELSARDKVLPWVVCLGFVTSTAAYLYPPVIYLACLVWAIAGITYPRVRMTPPLQQKIDRALSGEEGRAIRKELEETASRIAEAEESVRNALEVLIPVEEVEEGKEWPSIRVIRTDDPRGEWAIEGTKKNPVQIRDYDPLRALKTAAAVFKARKEKDQKERNQEPNEEAS